MVERNQLKNVIKTQNSHGHTRNKSVGRGINKGL